jgi:hypothetical protein
LITATSNWLVDEYSYDEGSDVGITRFMETLQGADVYYVSGTYCLMPLPDAFFTKPKTLRILTFLFSGTQLEHYMVKRGYGFYLHIDPNELALFKHQMNANLNVYKSTTNVKTGYEAITSKDATVRKTVGNFVKNLIQKLNKVGLEFNADRILIASSKDAWFGIEVNASSKVSNATSLKTLTRLGDATYTAMITRGTNKFKERDILIMMGKVNMHPDLAKFLGMGGKAAKDRHTLSELVQLIYRTAIRDGKEIFFITADADNVRILRNFLRN